MNFSNDTIAWLGEWLSQTGNESLTPVMISEFHAFQKEHGYEYPITLYRGCDILDMSILTSWAQYLQK